MTNEQDYKTAYEPLFRAMNEARQILAKAQVSTAAGLHMQADGELDKDLLEYIRRLRDSE